MVAISDRAKKRVQMHASKSQQYFRWEKIQPIPSKELDLFLSSQKDRELKIEKLRVSHLPERKIHLSQTRMEITLGTNMQGDSLCSRAGLKRLGEVFKGYSVAGRAS